MLANSYKKYMANGDVEKAKAIFKGNVPAELLETSEEKTRGRPKKADKVA